MCASGGCGSSHEARPSTYRHVISAFSLAPAESTPFETQGNASHSQGNLSSLQEAPLKGRAKYKNLSKRVAAMKKGKLTSRIFGIALVLVPGGVMPGGAPHYRERRVT